MRVLHTSDLHGETWRLYEHSAFDVWLDTGDFFPNMTRGIIPFEMDFQRGWFNKHAEKILGWLQGRPVLSVPGNHDFVSLVDMINQRKRSDAREITPRGITAGGFKWAGFRNINFIVGEWAGESQHDELKSLVEMTWASNHGILVTHAPPGGILDDTVGYGIAYLSTALAYHPHKIRTHFFGHCHEDAGRSVEEMGVTFYNGSRGAKIINI